MVTGPWPANARLVPIPLARAGRALLLAPLVGRRVAMSDSTTTRPESTTVRREPTSGRVRAVLEDAIKRPVKEALREVLAEGVQGSRDEPMDENERTVDESVTVESSEPTDTDGDGDGDDATSSDAESSNETARSLPRRLLGSRQTVVFVAVVVATYLRRRRRSQADVA